MAENISVDIGVNAQHLEQALRKIEDVFKKGTSELGGGAGGKAQISELSIFASCQFNERPGRILSKKNQT